MEHFKHKRCNVLLIGRPEDNVSDLNVAREQVRGHPGVVAVTSFWRPSEVDLANLLAGGSVAISIIGTTQPPMFVEVLPE